MIPSPSAMAKGSARAVSLAGRIESVRDLIQLCELQRFWRAFSGPDDAEHLTHDPRLGQGGEALLAMPLRQGRRGVLSDSLSAWCTRHRTMLSAIAGTKRTHPAPQAGPRYKGRILYYFLAYVSFPALSRHAPVNHNWDIVKVAESR